MTSRTILCIFLGIWCLCVTKAYAQNKVTLSGKVVDAANGESVIGATVRVKDQSLGTSTNSYGFYSMTLPQGTYTIQVSFIGYKTFEQQINLQSNFKLDVSLSEEDQELEAVEVTTKKEDQNVTSVEMSTNTLALEQVKKIPALLGEVDVVRSIQLLPGISSVGEGSAGFNVRGGGIDQNLILLDEAPVYNSSHLLGFFSVFNPDAVKDVKLIKGGIPAQYGGRLSSLLDVRLKEGNNKRFEGTGGIGTVSSRFAIEGPIQKDRSSFIVAGRRSYADLFLRLSSDENLRTNILYFYDISAKANYKINDRNTIFLSGYFGRDVFKFGSLFGFDWGNTTATLRWNHLFSDKLFSNFTLVYSDYDYRLGDPEGSDAFRVEADIINYSFKSDFNYFITPNSTLNFGGQVLWYDLNPGLFRPLGSNNIFNAQQLSERRGLESAAYLDHEWNVSTRLALQYGVRFSNFTLYGSGTFFDYVGESGQRKEAVNQKDYSSGETVVSYNNFEPRASLRYILNEKSSLKVSYNRTAQYIHLITNTTASLPTDRYALSSPNIKPELADQVALGYFRNFSDNKYEASIEGYYKEMQNQIDFIDGADLLFNEDFEGEILFGEGRSYGVEFFVKKNSGKLNGWLSYTFSRTERKIEGINRGDWYPAKYDRTHNLSLVGIYELNPRWTLGANFSYATGIATTYPNARYQLSDTPVIPVTDGSRNQDRLPVYHRLDISGTRKGKKREGKRWETEWVFSIYNIYARRNAFAIYFTEDPDVPGKTDATRFAVFGSLIPSVTYNFKF